MSVNCHLNAAGKPKQLTSAFMFTKKKKPLLLLLSNINI